MNIDPSTLKITDLRFADIDGAPKRCTLLKLYTNQGLVGYGEVRDASSRTYAAMLKSRILSENPLNVEKVFRRIRQFGGDSRQAGGVCAIELACWDIAGKFWGVPCGSSWGAGSATACACTATPTPKAADATWARPSRRASRRATPSSRWTSASNS